MAAISPKEVCPTLDSLHGGQALAGGGVIPRKFVVGAQNDAESFPF